MLKARRSARVLLLLAALAATTAVVLFLHHVNTVERQFGEFVEVLVAGQAIPARTPITDQVLDTVAIPRRYLRPGLLTSKDEAINRVSLVAVGKGEFLTASVLRSDPIPDGMRAITITAGQTVVFDGDLKPGDRVDVMAAFREEGQEVSRIVVHDLEVMGVTSEGRQKQLTVLAREEDAARLVWMENYGKQVRFIRSRLAKQGG
jgi:Flp pilus assembly protein CpaB